MKGTLEDFQTRIFMIGFIGDSKYRLVESGYACPVSKDASKPEVIGL